MEYIGQELHATGNMQKMHIVGFRNVLMAGSG